MPKLFVAGDPFQNGGWAPELKRRIVSRRFAPGWHPRSRIWRGTFRQWVQFEPEGWSGPFFWSSKPAIRAAHQKHGSRTPAAEGLFVGCYVERGTTDHPLPEARIDHRWHWHGFYRCLVEPSLRDELDRLMLDLPAERRTIWVDAPNSVESSSGRMLPSFDQVLPYAGRVTLDQTKEAIDASPPEQWINIVLGIRFSEPECVAGDEEQLIGELRTPIIRASEMCALIEASLPAGR